MSETMSSRGATGAVTQQWCWRDCWPDSAAVQAPWSGQLPAGLSTLCDPGADAAPHWLAVWAGHAPARQGQWGWCAVPGAAGVALQAVQREEVFWWPQAQPPADPSQLAQAWAQDWALRCAGWDAQAWQAHVQGFGLSPHLHKPLGHLSTGTWRKLGLAVALASGARLTLIDAPTAGLDRAALIYLAHALQALAQALRTPAAAQRWVLVAHWEALAGVDWQAVLALPETEAPAEGRAHHT